MTRESHTPKQKPTLGKRILFRAGAVALGLLVALVVAEIGARVYLAYVTRGELKDLSKEVPTDPEAALTFGDLIYPVENDDLVYRLKPGARGRFLGAPVEINEAGFHDEALPEEKDPDDVRIMVLGDSLSFGWGVARDDAWPNVLERALRRIAGDSMNIEVVNLAVPGYNAVMELENFREQYDRVKPDIVISQYCNNDTSIPSFMMKRKYLSDFSRIRLLDLLMPKGKDGITSEALALVLPDIQPERGRGMYEHVPLEEVPASYRHHVGVGAFKRAHAALRDECRAKGIPLVYMLPSEGERSGYDYRLMETNPVFEGIMPVFASLGVTVIDTYAETRLFALKHDLEFRDLVTHWPDDLHPNALRHALMAMSLLPPVAKLVFGDRYVQDDVRRESAILERRAASMIRSSAAPPDAQNLRGRERLLHLRRLLHRRQTTPTTPQATP